MSAQYTVQQGIVGVSRPEGKLPGVPFLTFVVPNDPHSQTNLNKISIESLSIKENIFVHIDP